MKNKLIFCIMIFSIIMTMNFQQCLAAEYRNPFMDYKLSEEYMDEELKLESLKSNLPFKLVGIIAGEKDKIAILNVGGETEFIKKAYEKDKFRIVYIGESRILINYHDLKAYMKIGGDLIATGN